MAHIINLTRVSTIMKKCVIIIVLTVVVLLSGCGKSGPEISSIRIQDESLTVEPGEQISLTVIVKPEDVDIKDANLIWENSDPDIASLSTEITESKYIWRGEIKVTGLKEGTTTIKVSTKGGVSDECQIIVRTLSAYEKLSADDQYICDSLKSFSSTMYNPKSLKLKDARLVEGEGVVLYITGMNGFGGYIDKYLGGIGPNFREKADLKYQTFAASPSCGYDISGINQALQEYYDEYYG